MTAHLTIYCDDDSDCLESLETGMDPVDVEDANNVAERDGWQAVADAPHLVADRHYCPKHKRSAT